MKKPGNAGGAKARQEGGCVESMTKQEELSKVEETPKQGREAESQKWSWVEAEVWTERMLTTLETGVKGGKDAYFIERGLYHGHSPRADLSVPPWTPLTGEPDAGEPHVRFGGRGGSNQ